MEITVNILTYNTYGGHSSISLVGRFFELDMLDFGDAIKELEINIYFRGGRKRKTLELLFEKFHKSIETLPSTKFYRKKNRFELNYLSKLGDANLVSGYGPAEYGLFMDSTKEIAEMLPMLKSKLKKNDNFDYEAFLSFIDNKMNQLPKNEEDFLTLQETVKAGRRKKLDAMDEWEKLGIDWIDFHPKARQRLNSPFFWDCGNDFSPNGNDTGADLLNDYLEWRKKNRNRSGMDFFEQLMSEWEVKLPLPENDDYSRQTYEEAIVGLAFAQLKVDAVCEPKVKNLALESIQNTQKKISEFHRDWDLYDERIRTLQIMENKLKENTPTLL